jgi:hypothetical protein
VHGLVDSLVHVPPDFLEVHPGHSLLHGSLYLPANGFKVNPLHLMHGAPHFAIHQAVNVFGRPGAMPLFVPVGVLLTPSAVQGHVAVVAEQGHCCRAVAQGAAALAARRHAQCPIAGHIAVVTP